MTWGISMEQDAAEIIKFCSEHNLKTIHCSYNPKKGWSVSQVYYDKDKQPKEWLTPRPSNTKDRNGITK